MFGCMLSLVLASVGPIAATPTPSANIVQTPNIVLIVSDDQAAGDYGFMGHPHIKTPHLDRLAAQSRVFRNGCVTSSLCCPSLASIITGRYPHETGIVANDPPELVGKKPAEMLRDPGYRAARQEMISFIDRVPTLPRTLAANGYLCLQTGKWWQGNFARGGFTHGMTHGNPDKGGRHGDVGLEIGRKTMQPIYEFVRDAKSQSRPFFIWYAPMMPHQPHNPPERLLAKYRAVAPSPLVAKYWAMVEWFDETCGQLSNFLDQENLAENTVVVFLSDNGWIQDPAKDRPLRSKKSQYDAGHRTPILVSWPGHVEPGSVETPVSSIDIAPTLLKAANVPSPTPLPGVNLLDTKAVEGRKGIFGEVFTHNAVDIRKPSASLRFRWIRQNNLRLVVPELTNEPSMKVQLFDVAADPGENTDLAPQKPEAVAELRRQLDAWWNPDPKKGTASTVLPGTRPLEMTGDLSEQMVAGIERFMVRHLIPKTIDRLLISHVQEQALLSPPQADPKEVQKRIDARRTALKSAIGAVDQRVPNPRFQATAPPGNIARIAISQTHEIYEVSWPVFDGVHGEGILCRSLAQESAKEPLDAILVLPDADQTPAMMLGLDEGLPSNGRIARGLLDSPCHVLVMSLIDRRDNYSGNAALKRFTNQPHREWIYRQAYEMGRHIIGYEVQKAQSAVDCLLQLNGNSSRRIYAIGNGEGAFIANYLARADGRLTGCLLCGLKDKHESEPKAWPLYRNVFRGWILKERNLESPVFLNESHWFAIPGGPPYSSAGRSGAAPAWTLSTTPIAGMERNGASASFSLLVEDLNRARGGFQFGSEGDDAGILTGKNHFAGRVDVRTTRAGLVMQDWESRTRQEPVLLPKAFAMRKSDESQKRQVEELVRHTQRLMRESEAVRQAKIDKTLAKAKSGKEWDNAARPLRKELWEDVLGKVDFPKLPMNARSRKILDKPKWTGYEVVLDVWPEVFAWGYFLVPNDIKPGERRPVVVCQHGLEGLPADTIDEAPDSVGYKYYKAFAARLAERGFVVFAPHNPYRGQDKFRVLQRMANPLGLSLFSFIIGQHDRILDFLCEQPFVDSKRIGFYGLSYGGKTAMRVPAVLDRYCLSICSADFNDWIKKCVTVDDPHSYMFTGEYEMPEWNLGFTFNYAEMAACICPRPFMVERGHDDGVAPDEWVAYEYAKVRRLYDKLGIGDRTEIEFFNGPHTINGAGTFRFLHKHLNWPVLQ